VTTSSRGPLDGVRIVDFSANMSGPYATMILGDQGADVIKIEPLDGDALRHVGSGSPEMSAYFANLNRSKRSIALDLTKADSRVVVDALLDSADVALHNFRSSVAERLRLESKDVRGPRPTLIYVAIGGFGPDGPYGGRPAYDHVIQALSGFAARQSDLKTGEPNLVRQGVIDKTTGIMAAQAVTAALFERTRTGVGREINIQMLDVAVSFLWPDGMMNLTMLDPPSDVQPDISKSFRLSVTKDGHVAFALVQPSLWASLAETVGVDSFDVASMKSRADVLRIVGRMLEAMTTDEAVAFLTDQNIPVSEVVALEDVADHPQVTANDVIDTFRHDSLGTVHQPNPIARFDERRAGDMRSAPRLGQHSREVLKELGLAESIIDGLVRGGVVGARSS
jgi:crotonobetainyl-CoA:carnitine CoA-transferase CaiB-like acyl-CoA transferase